jgi:20S proteasome alpha/beta subunit
MRAKDGVVLAADSRGTFGDPRGVTAQNDTQKKLYVLGKYVGVLTAGSGGLGAQLMRDVQTLAEERRAVGVTPIMELVRETAIQRYNEWFPGFAIQPMPGVAAPTRPDIALVVAGYGLDERGEPTEQRIYTLVSGLVFAPMLHDYGFALQGVAQYALYLLNRLYEPERPARQLEQLAAFVIIETASQDGKVGGPVQMVTILKEGGARVHTATEVGANVGRIAQLSDGIRRSFYRQERT